MNSVEQSSALEKCFSLTKPKPLQLPVVDQCLSFRNDEGQ